MLKAEKLPGRYRPVKNEEEKRRTPSVVHRANAELGDRTVDVMNTAAYLSEVRLAYENHVREILFHMLREESK